MSGDWGSSSSGLGGVYDGDGQFVSSLRSSEHHVDDHQLSLWTLCARTHSHKAGVEPLPRKSSYFYPLYLLVVLFIVSLNYEGCCLNMENLEERSIKKSRNDLSSDYGLHTYLAKY